MTDLEAPRKWLEDYMRNNGGEPINSQDFINYFNAGLYEHDGESFINEGLIKSPTLEEKVIGTNESIPTHKYQEVKGYYRQTKTNKGVTTYFVRAYKRKVKV